MQNKSASEVSCGVKCFEGKMLILLLLLVFGNENQPVESISENEINYLQDNFFASLKVDPRLQGICCFFLCVGFVVKLWLYR